MSSARAGHAQTVISNGLVLVSGGMTGGFTNAGLWGKVANDQQRRQLGVGKDDLALRVTFIHRPWSRGAGLKLNDYIVSIDGQTKNMRINELHSYLHLNKNWGDTIELVVRRGGKDIKMSMTFPDEPPN